MGQVLLRERHHAPVCQGEAPADLFVGDLPILSLAEAAVLDAAAIGDMDLVKAHGMLLRGRVQPDRQSDQPELNHPGPRGLHVSRVIRQQMARIPVAAAPKATGRLGSPLEPKANYRSTAAVTERFSWPL